MLSTTFLQFAISLTLSWGMGVPQEVSQVSSQSIIRGYRTYASLLRDGVNEGEICNVNRALRIPAPGSVEYKEYYECVRPNDQDWTWPEIGQWTKVQCEPGHKFVAAFQSCAKEESIEFNLEQLLVPQPCDNAVEAEVAYENGPCSWMNAPLAVDVNNINGYLQCRPDFPRSSLYCGVWQARPCAPGTHFEVLAQTCSRDCGHAPPCLQGCGSGIPFGECNAHGKCPSPLTCTGGTCCLGDVQVEPLKRVSYVTSVTPVTQFSYVPYVTLALRGVKEGDVCNVDNAFDCPAAESTGYFECVKPETRTWTWAHLGQWTKLECGQDLTFFWLKRKCVDEQEIVQYGGSKALAPPIVAKPCIEAAEDAEVCAGCPCSWMTAPLAIDPNNPHGYLQCRPDYPESEYCGVWQTKPCAPGTRFDVSLQTCVHDVSGGICGNGVDIAPCNSEGQCPGEATCTRGSCCVDIN